MIRVIVSGAAGSMGSLVCEAVRQASDLELVAEYDPVADASREPADLPDADVVVEFTNPDVVLDNVAAWHARGWHSVVGTSGFTDERIAHVEELVGDGPPNCLIVPNFSIGAVLSMRFGREAAPYFAAAEVI